MELLKKFNLKKKITIILVIVLLFNFIIPNYSKAADDENGGDLLDPLMTLVAYLGDVVMTLMEWCLTGEFHWIWVDTEPQNDSGNYWKRSCR